MRAILMLATVLAFDVAPSCGGGSGAPVRPPPEPSSETQSGANESGANEPGANESGANESGANESGANESGETDSETPLPPG